VNSSAATFGEAPPIPGWLAQSYPFHRGMARLGPSAVHFVDEGEGRPVLLVHGNPTWSFLWRKVIPRLARAGLRVVAPDLLGFGLSAKPSRVRDHTCEGHVNILTSLLEALDLTEVTVVGQDWGGPIAAGVAARAPHRVRAAVFANTTVLDPRRPLRTTTFHRLSRIPVVSEILFQGLGFPVWALHRVQGDPRSIGAAERKAYAYPFRRLSERAAPLAFARMVPHREGHPSLPLLLETDRWARAFKGPSALVWGRRDPILGRALKRMREAMPSARVVETEAGHFLQEEVPEALADAIVHVSAPG
jgi:pimeloyl-ACP methyl ester carboxylesterase